MTFDSHRVVRPVDLHKAGGFRAQGSRFRVQGFGFRA